MEEKLSHEMVHMEKQNVSVHSTSTKNFPLFLFQFHDTVDMFLLREDTIKICNLLQHSTWKAKFCRLRK